MSTEEEELTEVHLSDEEEEEDLLPKQIKDEDDDESAEDDDDESVEDDDDEDEDNETIKSEEEETQKEQQRQQSLGLLDAADADEDDGGGEAYLKKLDPAQRTHMMAEYHPELLMENNQDVQYKTVIRRDAEGRISDPLHRTLPFLTKYEKARILGERAKQLNAGAVPMVTVPEYIIDGYLIALQEFEEKKIPFIVKRPLGNRTCEYWKVADLEVL
jgi:DNA-directed RNA polymerase I, II, and III subunit RPABC2